VSLQIQLPAWRILNKAGIREYPISARLSADGPIYGSVSRDLENSEGRERMAPFRAPNPKRKQAGSPDGTERRGPVPRDLKRAVDYIRAHLDRRMSIAGLVTHCGIPERTLRKHFRTFMAASPLEFSRQLRLAAARACLLGGSKKSSVTEVATRFGFGHFGRFAQDYRTAFGETPFATLQRNRIDRQQHRTQTRNESPCVTIAANGSRDRPSIAVLSFDRSAAEANCPEFAEFLADGIATTLCRVRALSVTIPKSSRARSGGLRQAAFDVGARYLLGGRIVQRGGRARVLVRLLDAQTEVQLWGDVFDGEIDDLFELADRVTASVMRAIPPRVRDAEIERTRRKRPEDLVAGGLTMRALPFVFASKPAAAEQALDLLHKAIEIEPDHALATSLAAWCHAQLVLYNGTSSPDRERKTALLLGERAGILDLDDDPLVLTARCAVHTMAGQLDHASALISRSLELDPTLVWSWERSGWLNAYLGYSETAVSHFEHATRLDAGRSNASRLAGLGCAWFGAGLYEQAVRLKRLALREDPGTAWINRSLSVSYARLGDRLAALEAVEALRRYSPDITITGIVSSLPFTRDFLHRLAEGLDDLGLAA
jgi:TolB-like protein/AraC-like DNA-binding protein